MTAVSRTRKLFARLTVICIISFLGILVVPRQLETRDIYVPRATDVEQEVASLLPPPREEEQTVAFSIPTLIHEPTIAATKNAYDTRICTSPEYNVTFPLMGKIPSATSTLQCGTLSATPTSHFFNILSTNLKDEYGEMCKDAVRFGVSFGRFYTKKLKPRRQSPHKCAFTFVLEEEMPTTPSALIKSFGWETLIPVPRHVLPYNSMRRNVKLFKLHGHELFPWTKLLIWQDVKLKPKIYPSPLQFFKKFMRTPLGESCLTVVGLPTSNHTLGYHSRSKHYRPKYQHHCDAVVDSIKKRPNVTDSVSALLQQCRYYQEKNVLGVVSLDRGLIDSAFIVWNQKTPQCRDFNAKLACTWSDEIQCHSDRDQISFPYVLQRMGMNESKITKSSNIRKQSLYMVDGNDQVMIQILKSSCHWYFHRFPNMCPYKDWSTKLNVTTVNS